MARVRKRKPTCAEQATVVPSHQEAGQRLALSLPIDRFEQRPILRAIVKRCTDLGAEASRLHEGSPQRKALDRRIRRLDAYTFPHLYEKPTAEQEEVVRRFATILLERGDCGWEEVKKRTDEFASRIRKRRTGRPIKYRYRITEALEIKLANPSRTWEEIWDEMSEKLDISFEVFNRQIQHLRQLLHKEGIPTPSQRAD